MTQPEALRLADDMLNCSFGRTVTVQKAAAELRRLHDDYENALKHFAEVVDGYKQMAAQRDELLAALERSRAQWIHSVNAEQCLAAIAKAQQ